MILVVGGTGRLGSLVVNRLVARGEAVRVMTRDASRAEHLPAGVQVIPGDLQDPASLAAPVAGVDLVVAAAHGFEGPGNVSPAGIDRDGNINLINTIRNHGAELVMMSLVGAAPDAPMELQRMKYAASSWASSSGVATTVIAATAFADLWISILTMTAAKSGRPLVFGRGENPINFVAASDVADLVEIALFDRTTRGMTLEIGGPENVTMNHLARLVQEAAGRTSQPRHIPQMMLRVMGPIIERVNPARGRQIRASLSMDTIDLTFDAGPIHRTYPQLPNTPIEQVVKDQQPSR